MAEGGCGRGTEEGGQQPPESAVPPSDVGLDCSQLKCLYQPVDTCSSQRATPAVHSCTQQFQSATDVTANQQLQLPTASGAAATRE
jgi:hypothetical protein